MEVQISRSVHSQIPQEDPVRRVEPASRGSVSQAGATEGKQDRGGASDAHHLHMMISMPPKYAVSQVIGFIKGKSAWREETQFCGAGLLSPRILRLHRRSGRSRDQGVHPETRAGGHAPGSDEPVALISHLWVAQRLRGRVSDPYSRFERPHN